ncbi:Hypothetical protein CINCED_3A002642 [Cinara cedri]|uniref:PWWP domain-containing protein n=1 Tax=Cinara cedri TaxID=506608 RepID=A0A5E4NDB5_9HEMI|nr:Hypothetical protein CINCED_3A002642 [Cinara cedri]
MKDPIKVQLIKIHEMSDQTIQPFTPGTLVWTKVYNRIWWPGKIVDPKTAPQELQEFMNRKKNPIAMVYFERDKKYDIVINMDKISLYSCPKKMEFVEKGYSLYLKELKGTKTQNVEMANFIKDVIMFEEQINGNVDIFKVFEKKFENNPPPKELIKELFVSSKSTKKSLTNKTPSQSRTSLKSRGPLKFQENPVRKSRASIQPSGSFDGNFACHLKDGCNFTTNRYETLKRHMALCKTIVKDGTKSELKIKTLLQLQNKRKNTTKIYSTKKTKTNDTALKDWDDGEVQGADNSLNHNAKPGCSTESNKKTILTKFNDNITHIATDATENVDEYLEDCGTIEKGLGNICIESNKILDPIPSVSGTNMLRKNSCQGSIDSETNDIPNKNMTDNTEENTINDIDIDYEKSNKTQENSYDLSEENMRNMPSTSSQQSFYPLIEESIQDEEENLDQSCSTEILDSEIKQLDDVCLESELVSNNNSVRFKRSNDEEEAREAFLNNIINCRPVTHIDLDINIDSTENKTETEEEKRLREFSLATLLLLQNVTEINFEEDMKEVINTNIEFTKLSTVSLEPRVCEIEHDIPIHYCTELMDNTLPPNVVRELVRIPLKPPELTEEEVARLVNVDVPEGVLQLIGCVRVPNETETEPTNDNDDDDDDDDDDGDDGDGENEDTD